MTDFYMHWADLKSFLEADQRVAQLYARPNDWARKAILNVASSGQVLERSHDQRVRV
jgi:starch phosphorylase